MKRSAALLLFIILVSVGFLLMRPKTVLSRINILVGSDPVVIWSWDREAETFTVITLPAGLATDAPGYGRYSLESLWKLGFIDKKDGSVLARGLTDALAIPIPWFIGETGDGFRQTTRFSPFQKKVTNMPFLTFLSFWWEVSRARPDAVETIDFVGNAPVAKETLPDGSVRQYIDPERADEMLKGQFEDERIRAENLTVGVYNTTNTPALGTSAARLLTTQGVLVVTVGNSEPEIQECRVEGSELSLQTRTASVIEELLGCTKNATGSEARVDLTVRLGSDYASR